VVEQPIRNRQVASSTLALGSNLLRVIYLISTGVVSPVLAGSESSGLNLRENVGLKRHAARCFSPARLLPWPDCKCLFPKVV
jgi:hypothetical protein